MDDTSAFAQGISAEPRENDQSCQARLWSIWWKVSAALPILALLALTAIFLLFSVLSTRLDHEYHEYGCDPLGKIWAGEPKPDIWDIKYALTITTAFGEFTFPTAKGIDIAWDFAVGRGLQMVAAWTLYRLFRGPIANSLQHDPQPYSTVLALQYDTTSSMSLWSYGQYARKLMKRGRKHTYVIIMLVFSTVYVLSLPTWLSAMSGYQARTIPLLPWANNTYLSFDVLSPCSVVIVDGSRVNLTDNFCVSAIPFGQLDTTEYFNTSLALTYDYPKFTHDEGASAPSHPIRYKQKDDSTVFEWYWDVPTWLNMSGQTIHLRKPSLHFAQSIVRPPAMEPVHSYEVQWYQNSFFQVGMYAYGGHAFSFSDLRNLGICQPQKQYQWGFSFLLTFAFLAVSIVLFTALYVAWCFSGLGAKSERTMEVFGSFKTAVEVTSLLREKIGAVIDLMDDEAIAEAVKSSSTRVVAQDDGLISR